MTWTSANPHLLGNFAPIFDELDVDSLQVVAGRIPDDLAGVYMRNGPNPLFEPISYTYPFDGDGMIHAVYLNNGKARYKNRFVKTRGLEAEQRAGRALYGGILAPIPVDPALVLPDGDPGPFKNGAFVHVIEHAGRILALLESTTGYELTGDLDTIGEWCAGTDKPLELGAHTRRHPVTGGLFAVSYSVEHPTVTFHQIDANGRYVESTELTMAAPTMVHDFILTEHHIVVLAGPVVFDFGSAAEGNSPIQWRPGLGTQICLIPLDGGKIRRLQADPFFVFHFANGFERQGRIVIDYVRHQRLHFGASSGDDHLPPMLHRMTIETQSGRIEDRRLMERSVEFPRVDGRRDAMETRFIYVPTLTETFTQTGSPAGTFNAIARMDTETGHLALQDFGNGLVGEPVFVPKDGSTAEDDGYIALFVFDPADRTSDFVLLDARHIDAAPVAVVRMPRRVPQGLHGSWIASG